MKTNIWICGDFSEFIYYLNLPDLSKFREFVYVCCVKSLLFIDQLLENYLFLLNKL